MGYTGMTLMQQVDLMRQETSVGPALTGKAAMWTKARAELDEAAISVGQGADHMEGAANWADTAGAPFVLKNREAKKNLDHWVRQIDASDVPATFQRLSDSIFDTCNAVIANHNAAQRDIAALGALATPAMAAMIEQHYVGLNAGLMTALDGEYDNAAGVVTAAAAGPDWGQTTSVARGGGPNGNAPGAQAPAGPGAAAQEAMAQAARDQQALQAAQEQQAEQAQQGAEAPSGQQEQPAQAQQGPQGPGVSGGGGGEPGLSGGLGAAPTIPPVTPPNLPPGVVPGANIVPPVPGGPSPILPLSPVAGLGSAVRAGGGGGGIGGGVGGAGIRLPGVGGGGVGATSIPTAVSPVSPPSVPAVAAAPTAAAGANATGATGGPGGVPPMMPPMGMGGAGVGGGGGGPAGPGAVSRPRNRRRDNGRTPGLPAMLSGKAGTTDPHSFVARARTVKFDVPATVQLIDEDLWQVEAQRSFVDQTSAVARVRR